MMNSSGIPPDASGSSYNGAVKFKNILLIVKHKAATHITLAIQPSLHLQNTISTNNFKDKKIKMKMYDTIMRSEVGEYEYRACVRTSLEEFLYERSESVYTNY